MTKLKLPGCKSTNFNDLFGILKLVAFVLFVFISTESAEGHFSATSGKKTDKVAELQQKKQKVTGTVFDETGEPLVSANIVEVGTTNGTLTDPDGKFTIEVGEKATLRISYIGYITKDITVKDNKPLIINLEENAVQTDEVVIVGYGVQKKESVVASIAQAGEKELRRTGNSGNLTEALAGQLPGLVTLTSSGEPGGTTIGNSSTSIYIRGQNTWNGGGPLILVDGVERSMNNIDVNEVANISILKDASATAVFGVKGANGVVLITTKRGESAKTKLNFNYTSTGTVISKLPEIMESYESLVRLNESIEREVALNSPSWNDIYPYEVVTRFRKPQSAEYAMIYPNINWADELFSTMGFSQRATLSAQGGSSNVKYYGLVAYLHEGDQFRDMDNHKGYNPNYNYDRFNFRSNIDFDLTSTTKLSIDFSGFYSQKNTNYNNEGSTGRADWWMWAAAYRLAPDMMYPYFKDEGLWGAYQEGGNNTVNPLAVVHNLGLRQQRQTQLNSNFTLNQKLDFITPGLTASLSLFYDNMVRSEGGIYDINNHVRPNEEAGNVAYKQIYPLRYEGPEQDPSEYTSYMPNSTGEYDWIIRPWTIRAEGIDTHNFDSSIPVRRRLMYQFQLNYARTFGLHNVGVTGVMKRETQAYGNMFPNYREDWVGRLTYNFDSRYLLEVNAAYNGSEKFGPNYRFELFPSLALGYYLSNEKFWKVPFIDRLKLRYSKGWVGDDNGGTRWSYISQMAYGGRTRIATATDGYSSYYWYRETVVGNPDLRWESAVKDNYGIEMGFFKSQLGINFDYFTEDRTDIIIAGGSRAMPAFYGTTPPDANLGHVKSKGFEIEVNVNKNIMKDFDLWSKIAITHNENTVLFRDDPPLQYPNLKAAGFQIGQTKSLKSTGFYNSWDDVYASVPTESNDLAKMPGYYNLLDYSADGMIKDEDRVPVGYSQVPQNTAAFTLGVNYKSFSFMAQLYGVNNATRVIGFNNFINTTHTVYAHAADYWTKDNQNAASFLPRWRTSGENIGNYFVYDASYLRLRMVELGYSLNKIPVIKKMGIENMRIFLNGNNLFFWSDLPDDRETTYSGGSDTEGAYPTMKRFNIGMDITF
ncbi:MAG: TonB-dependent receptor [Tannerella sp.]|nr:TonB-dependent receptor [Tannerella sp.]